MNLDDYRIFYCDATKYVEYKIPRGDLENALETLKIEIRIDSARTVGNDYWYVSGRYDK